MEYIKKLHILCLTPWEMRALHRKSYEYKLDNKMKEKKISFEGVKENKKLLNDFVDEVLLENRKKEDIEFFIAIDLAFKIFDYNVDNVKICFDLKPGIQAEKISFDSLNDLKSIINERSMRDFSILDKGLIQFQLKQYQGNKNTIELFDFIKEKVRAYGEMGDINLLVLLNSRDYNGARQEMDIRFNELHAFILGLNYQFKGQIFIIYNEENENDVFYQIYPEFRMNKYSLSGHKAIWYY